MEVAGGGLEVGVAVLLNQVAYLQCCQKYDCEVLTIPQLLPGPQPN
jgi:hypothetical protein